MSRDWQWWRLAEAAVGWAYHEVALARRERIHAAIVRFGERNPEGDRAAGAAGGAVRRTRAGQAWPGAAWPGWVRPGSARRG